MVWDCMTKHDPVTITLTDVSDSWNSVSQTINQSMKSIIGQGINVFTLPNESYTTFCQIFINNTHYLCHKTPSTNKMPQFKKCIGLFFAEFKEIRSFCWLITLTISQSKLKCPSCLVSNDTFQIHTQYTNTDVHILTFPWLFSQTLHQLLSFSSSSVFSSLPWEPLVVW